jgi:putative addiction module component (TIGR02574 family)
MSVDALLKEVETLSDAERAEFFERLGERYPDLGAEADPRLTPEMEAELKRRVAAADANPNASVPWEVVYEESLKRARK